MKYFLLALLLVCYSAKISLWDSNNINQLKNIIKPIISRINIHQFSNNTDVHNQLTNGKKI
jgi:hypothetical protein